MDTNVLQKHFGRMGARLNLGVVETTGFKRTAARIDIRDDDAGEYFLQRASGRLLQLLSESSKNLAKGGAER